MDITIRRSQPSDWPAAAQVDARNFGFQYSEQDLEDDKLILDRSRFFVAEDAGRVVGLAGDFALTMTLPASGTKEPLTRILIGMHDHYTGLDMKSFRVVADFPLDGAAAGVNLALRFKNATDGVWELRLKAPAAPPPHGKLTVEIKDRQGNLSRIERTLAIP